MITLTYQSSYPQLLKQYRRAVFGLHTYCPRCGFKKPQKISSTCYWCKRCRRRFSLASCSVFKGSKLPLKKLILLLECWLKGIPVKQTAGLMGLSRQTVYRWYRKFRENSPEIKEKFSQDDTLVLDDSYFGGRRKENRGRRCPLKTLVLGLFSFKEKKIKTLIMPYMDFRVIATFLSFNMPRETRLFSDDHVSYLYAKNWLRLRYHTLINHQVRFLETNPIENVWSVMKYKLRSIYHHATKRYMPDYIKELTYRFNTRDNPNNAFEFLWKTGQNFRYKHYVLAPYQ